MEKEKVLRTKKKSTGCIDFAKTVALFPKMHKTPSPSVPCAFFHGKRPPFSSRKIHEAGTNELVATPRMVTAPKAQTSEAMSSPPANRTTPRMAFRHQKFGVKKIGLNLEQKNTVQ